MTDKLTPLVSDLAETQPQTPVSPYWQVATSENTRKAYQTDIRHFIAAGGLLPTTTEGLLRYLNQQANKLNTRTLKRRIVAIKNWHTYQGFKDPTAHPIVKKTIRGIARTHGQPAIKAQILSVEQLTTLVTRLAASTALIDIRDNALLQIGFFGAFRRSELVAITWENISFVLEGVEILVPRSKTDVEATGETCAIPYGKSPLCPITALTRWQKASGITSGAVFRAIRYDRCNTKRGMSAAMVSDILKRHALKCQLPNATQYSGHSLRRGFATAASQNGASLGAIMRQGRWHHEGTVYGYIEAGQRFEANAAAAILEQPADNK